MWVLLCVFSITDQPFVSMVTPPAFLYVEEHKTIEMLSKKSCNLKLASTNKPERLTNYLELV